VFLCFWECSNDGHWQDENISEDQDAIIAKAIETQECCKLISIYLVWLLYYQCKIFLFLILYLYVQLNNVQQSFVNTATQSMAQSTAQTNSKAGKDSDDVVDDWQQLCAENIPVGQDGPWQAENISEDNNAILAKAVEIQECCKLLSLYLA
jgi:hypothetical protein